MFMVNANQRQMIFGTARRLNKSFWTRTSSHWLYISIVIYWLHLQCSWCVNGIIPKQHLNANHWEASLIKANTGEIEKLYAVGTSLLTLIDSVWIIIWLLESVLWKARVHRLFWHNEVPFKVENTIYYHFVHLVLLSNLKNGWLYSLYYKSQSRGLL